MGEDSKDIKKEEHNSKTIRKSIENCFESILYKTKFIILIAVICSVIAAAITFIMGSMFIFSASYDFIHNFFNLSEKLEEEVIVKFITSIDLFLFGIILIILSMGSYDLFISKLDPAYKKGATPNWLKFHNINEMKEPLLHVIIIILVITFFKYVIRSHYTTAYEIMLIPIGIALIGLGLFLINKAEIKHTEVDGQDDHLK